MTGETRGGTHPTEGMARPRGLREGSRPATIEEESFMTKTRARRGGLLGVSLVLLAALATTAAAVTEPPPEASEVWVADQGTYHSWGFRTETG